MTEKTARIHRLRLAVELVFLALFILLFVKGAIERWLVVFAAGAIASLFFGRIYCGWICPMNTLFRPLAWLKGKLSLKSFRTPKFFALAEMRFVFLALIMASMLVMKKSGRELPMPAFIAGISLLVTAFFEEALWHNVMCPYGSILSLTSRLSKRGMNVSEPECIACGKCQKVCPVYALDTLGTKKRRIRKQDCLTCHVCAEVCPTDAIEYR